MQTGCTDKPSVQFGSPPVPFADILNIAPYGLMVGAHVIPSDHQGYRFGPQSATPRYSVLSVDDGEIVSITVRSVSVDSGKPSSPQYHVTVRHSCSIITKYDLIDQLDPAIEALQGDLLKGKPIPVKEGQVIGKAGASSQGVDLWVADLRTLAPGYVVPQHYEGEAWRLYAIEPFTLFREPLRSQLREKSILRVEPRGGRADTDIDGRLVGGWFVENTNGYPGLSQTAFFRTHLAITHHAYDPTAVIISMGNYNGKTAQYAVKGNSPDPSQVTLATGLVQYELVNWMYVDTVTGKQWDYKAPIDTFRVTTIGDVLGTVLVQLTSNRKLKFEAFPGKRANEVQGFTSAAVTYER